MRSDHYWHQDEMCCPDGACACPCDDCVRQAAHEALITTWEIIDE